MKKIYSPPTQGESTMNEFKRLSDAEWVNVVNSPLVLACGGGHAAEDAVAVAFKLIEGKLYEKNQPMIDAMQSRLELLEQEMQEQARIIGMCAERELALAAKVESMEKDAVRIDWMEKTGRVNIDRVREGRIDGPIRWDVEYGRNDQEARSKKCLRAAIDTAMQANKGESC